MQAIQLEVQVTDIPCWSPRRTKTNSSRVIVAALPSCMLSNEANITSLLIDGIDELRFTAAST